MSEDRPVIVEPVHRRIRILFGGRVIADSLRARLLFELRYTPRYYLPLEDVAADVLVPSSTRTRSWCKGEARWWDVRVGDRVAPDAAWQYPESSPVDGPDLSGLVSFVWDAMDHWFEEEDEVFVHPKDPYSRLEILESSRRVEVRVEGVDLARSTRPRIAYEGASFPRFYLPPLDVRQDLLVPSQTTTACPYKGRARYYGVRLPDGVRADLAWSYPIPTPEATRLAGYISFFQEHCEVLVDGEPIGHPESKWLYGGPNAYTYTPGDPTAKTGFDDPPIVATNSRLAE